MKPRLNIVTLGVADLQESKEFYQKALGWEPAAGSDENIFFQSRWNCHCTLPYYQAG